MMLDLRPVAYIVGWQVLGLGGLMVLPLGIDLYDGSINAEGFAIWYTYRVLVTLDP